MQETERVTETLRDTTIVVRPDSATVRALLLCDSANHVLVRLLEAGNGHRVSAGLGVETHPDGSATLTVDCQADSLRMELQLRDREIERLRGETHTVLVPRDLSWWQRTFIAIGVMCTILFLATAGIGIWQAVKGGKK